MEKRWRSDLRETRLTWQVGHWSSSSRWNKYSRALHKIEQHLTGMQRVLPPSPNAALLDGWGAYLRCGSCKSKLLQAEKEIKPGISAPWVTALTSWLNTQKKSTGHFYKSNSWYFFPAATIKLIYSEFVNSSKKELISFFIEEIILERHSQRRRVSYNLKCDFSMARMNELFSLPNAEHQWSQDLASSWGNSLKERINNIYFISIHSNN